MSLGIPKHTHRDSRLNTTAKWSHSLLAEDNKRPNILDELCPLLDCYSLFYPRFYRLQSQLSTDRELPILVHIRIDLGLGKLAMLCYLRYSVNRDKFRVQVQLDDPTQKGTSAVMIGNERSKWFGEGTMENVAATINYALGFAKVFHEASEKLADLSKRLQSPSFS